MIDFNKKRKTIGYILSTLIIVTLSLALIIPKVVNRPTRHKNSFITSESKNVNYSISTGSEGATEVGEHILNKGGNAIDAAIAISFSLGVTSPQSAGIGGGGVMLVYDPQLEKAYTYDFYNSSGSEYTNSQIGIPGFLKGMELAYHDYATLPIDDLLEFPIAQARDGIKVSSDLASSLNLRPFVAEVNSNFHNNFGILKEGDSLIQEDLAVTMEAIRDEGFGIMYDGQHELSLNLMEASKIDAQSLKEYEARVYNALETDFNGTTIYGAGSPFSGATAIQMYKLLSTSNLDFKTGIVGEDILEYDQIYNYAYDQNSTFVGDNDLSRAYNEDIIDDIYLQNSFTGDFVYSEDFSENENTISYSVIDKDGMIVIGTNTLSNLWGSVVSNDGIFYNNSLKNFSSSPANMWEPMKRPKTFISPLIVYSDDDNIIGIGAAGGNTIPQLISTSLTMNYKHDLSFDEIIDTQRFARNNDKYRIEHKTSRTNNLVTGIGNFIEPAFYKQGGYFNTMTIVTKEDGEFNSYHEIRTCSDACATSKNSTDE